MEEKNSKKNVIDWAVAGAALLGLVICFFFWGCSIDLWVTVVALILIAAGTVLLATQHRKA